MVHLLYCDEMNIMNIVYINIIIYTFIHVGLIRCLSV